MHIVLFYLLNQNTFRSKSLVPGWSNKLGEWLSESLSVQFFSAGYPSNGGHDTNEICHKGSLGGEDDARMSNTCIVLRKHGIPIELTLQKSSSHR